jgi:hypothetical protein
MIPLRRDFLFLAMAATTGYSSTPLAKKLGIKAGFVVSLINQPKAYFELFADWPQDVTVSEDKFEKKDFVHFFTTDAKELSTRLPRLKEELKPTAMLWISWPKKASKVPTTVTEDLIRDIALRNGLVDIKVCAIDEVWSGLKLVIPVKHRKMA